jgi:hypothetical protein
MSCRDFALQPGNNLGRVGIIVLIVEGQVVNAQALERKVGGCQFDECVGKLTVI